MDTATNIKSTQHQPNTCGTCGSSKGADGKALNCCGQCKPQHYCSRDCQRKDWAAHKHACKKLAATGNSSPNKATVQDTFSKDLSSLATSSIGADGKGASSKGTPPEATPLQGDLPNESSYSGMACFIASEPFIGPITMPRATVSPGQLQSPGWVDLAFARAVGCPLRILVSFEDGTGYVDPLLSKAGLSHNVTIIANKMCPTNEYAEILGLDPDPRSPTFGKSCWQSRPVSGALLVRDGLQELHVEQVKTLVDFAYRCSSSIKKAKNMAQKGNGPSKEEVAATLFDPKMLKEQFEHRKEVEMPGNPKAWEGVVCPTENA